MTESYDLASLRAACADGSFPEFLFFWGCKEPPGAPAGTLGPWVLSQWYPASFVVSGIKYATAEHWMMAGKASTFDDEATLAQILADSNGPSPDPRIAKMLGRQVRGFDNTVWEGVGFDHVVQGNVYKFGQNEELGHFLRGTKDKILVEASPHDPNWGIGIAQSHAEARNPLRWPGRNLLGFALMRVRTRLSSSHEDLRSPQAGLAVTDDFFDSLNERAEDPFELSRVPTQALLEDLRRRMGRGEAVPEINYWIGSMAGLSLIEEYAMDPSSYDLAWLLNTLASALSGNSSEYEKWVAKFEQKSGCRWEIGVTPQNRR